MEKIQKIVFLVSFAVVCSLFFNFNAPIANAVTDQNEEWCHNFNESLQYGDTGAEVEALQMALHKQGFALIPYQQGDENYGNFERRTASAVVGFQQKYKEEILDPLGLKHGTGLVRESTRIKLNQLYGCGTTPPPEQPVCGNGICEQGETPENCP